ALLNSSIRIPLSSQIFSAPIFTSACLFLIPLFFSSRRRHTTSKRDWSSDVCSSDLPVFGKMHRDKSLLPAGQFISFQNIVWQERSEERRVGKECVAQVGSCH